MRKEKFSGVKKAQDYKKDMLSFETIIMLKIIGDSDDQLLFNGNFVYLFFPSIRFSAHEGWERKARKFA